MSPRDAQRLMSALAQFRDVDAVFNALLTGLPTDRLDVLTGVPTAAVVQRRVRRKVSLAG